MPTRWPAACSTPSENPLSLTFVTSQLSVIGVEGLPEVRPGANLARLIAEACIPEDGDVVVVTQKIVSKAENRLAPVESGTILALVEAESTRILRRRRDLVIAETPHGFVCANAGVDRSNVERGWVALLPRDSDRSARRIRDGLGAITGSRVGVIITDTFGRAWRRGVTDVAIGVAGIAGVVDLRGTADALGGELVSTEVCVADEIAGAAELVMGKARRIPVALVRGVDPAWLRESSVAGEVVRAHTEDLFR